MPEEVRIGVFVCHCGKNIGGVVDVPAVVDYARTLRGVAFAGDNLFTCSEEGLSNIRRHVQEDGLDRVVVASCTPRTHEPLFRANCESVGMNRYLFEFVNIRDQCSWVHMRDPENATAKAKALVRMGVARARLLEPLEESEVPVAPVSLVVGGGVVGMSAALNLANQGFQVHLVEKKGQLGGLVSQLNTLFTAGSEAGSTLAPLVQAVERHDKVTLHMRSVVKDVTGFVGSFEVLIASEGGEETVQAGTIIVATGAHELKPMGQYGYGEMSNVVTELELEERMRKGVNGARSVVFINCVGARTPEHPYCSRFCCMTSIKNAALVKETDPKAQVYVLHRDLMASGAEFERCYRKAMESGVRFVRYGLDRPPQVVGAGKAEAVRVWHQLLGRELELPADLVVLTTPLVAPEDSPVIGRLLKVPVDSEGWFLEAHVKLQPVEFATEGIFVCGAGRWPTDISEGVSQAYAAAGKASIPMRRGVIRPEAITALVNEDRCTGCGVCEGLCPYGAIERHEMHGKLRASVNAALCKGCGTCGAACPSAAITMNHYKSEQVFAQIEALAATMRGG